MKIMRKGADGARFYSELINGKFERNSGSEVLAPRKLKNGEERTYHMFPTFEVIHTVIPPNGKESERHCHYCIYEYYYVVEGEVVYKEEGSPDVKLNKGDALLTEPADKGAELWHRIENASPETCAVTLVVKVLADHVPQAAFITQDKVVEPDF